MNKKKILLVDDSKTIIQMLKECLDESFITKASSRASEAIKMLDDIMASMQVAYFWPSLGEGYLLTTLSSVFLGGTSVFGGVGTILGTFIGAFIIGAINAAIVAIGLTGFWTQLIYGLIIILSVTMHSVLRRRMK